MTRRSPPSDGRNLPTVPDTVSLTTSLSDRQKPEDELESPRCRDVLVAAADSCNRPPSFCVWDGETVSTNPGSLESFVLPFRTITQ